MTKLTLTEARELHELIDAVIDAALAMADSEAGTARGRIARHNAAWDAFRRWLDLHTKDERQRRAGAARSDAKAAAARTNGKLGGRPRRHAPD